MELPSLSRTKVSKAATQRFSGESNLGIVPSLYDFASEPSKQAEVYLVTTWVNARSTQCHYESRHRWVSSDLIEIGSLTLPMTWLSEHI